LTLSFFNEKLKFRFLYKSLAIEIIELISKNEKKKFAELNVIFTSDKNLLSLNKKYLQHFYFTDIITFDLSHSKEISGELYISVDSVKKNAITFKTTFKKELLRVIIHGVLHLVGYKDKSKKDIILMRSKEDFYLNKLNF